MSELRKNITSDTIMGYKSKSDCKGCEVVIILSSPAQDIKLLSVHLLAGRGCTINNSNHMRLELFHGSVAHLGERLLCTQKVAGSSPVRSTNSELPLRCADASSEMMK